MSADKDKYRDMADHDILIEVAVRQEMALDKLDSLESEVKNHERRLTTQETICKETRKNIYNNPDGSLKPQFSTKQKAVGGTGLLTIILTSIYCLGKVIGWW